MSEDRKISTIGSGQGVDQIAATLASAFQDDPAFTWITPDPDKRKRILPRFFRMAANQSHRHGEVLASQKAQTASLWYPSGHVRDNALTSAFDIFRYASIFGFDLPRGMKLGEAIHAHHPEPQPYAYLRYVGVSPEEQGKGWGGASVRAGIARSAEKGLGVLLETATPDNVAIYTRLGFEILEEWNAPDGGPKFWTMIRPAN